jgi:hypothetical protein
MKRIRRRKTKPLSKAKIGRMRRRKLKNLDAI